MASAGLQILGMALSVIGWIGAIACCALPMWKVTAFIGQSIVTAQTIWEGLRMNCVVQSTGQMQCKMYDSMLNLPQDLQAARALTIVVIILAIIGVFVAIAGGNCINCEEDKNTKAKICIVAGIIFVVSGVLLLIPVCWTANVVIHDFYNQLVPAANKRELGASLFIGWAGAALFLIGGGLLCCNCPKKDKNYSAKYTASKASQPNYV
ncbi:claudin-4-like [Protopterus annectens]|uniref:claudin-4-like n=1 Tax=Protopterus annectens TaxID=7888 RepID=UPI001CFBB2B2|nr:claudin-4-like [Protopterus annectens]